jgi:Peptidase family S41
MPYLINGGILKFLNFLVFLLSIDALQAQECDCKITVDSLIKKVERDYPAFNFSKNLFGTEEYKVLKKNSYRSLEDLSIPCQIIISRYLSFFKDQHFSFTSKGKLNLKDVLKKGSRGDNFSKLSPLEGIWQYEDAPAYINLKMNNGYLVGRFLYDFGEKIDSSKIFCIVYYSESSGSYEILYNGINNNDIQGVFELKYKNNVLSCGNINKFTRVKKVQKFKYSFFSLDFEAKRIDSNSFYIAIPDLVAIKKRDIDSILNKYKDLIISSKNLILDLRNNVGGSVLPMKAFNQYIYTNPIQFTSSYIYANESNINDYQTYCNNLENKEKDSAYYNPTCSRLLPLLKQSFGKLIYDQSTVYLQDSIYKNPQNVAILINKFTASAAELSTYSMLQSKKVKVFGENSFGMFDCGGVSEFQVCQYTFSFPTEMMNHVFYKKYDYIGITPDVFLQSNQNKWIDEVVKFYNKRVE